jgi:predicted DNA-binding transcriptional regulator AlpA
MTRRPETRRNGDRSHAPNELLTPAEVARLLRLPSVETLYQWRRKRTGPPAVRVGRHLRYDPAKLARWLDERTDAGE